MTGSQARWLTAAAAPGGGLSAGVYLAFDIRHCPACASCRRRTQSAR
jgi:hypothetical protein